MSPAKRLTASLAAALTLLMAVTAADAVPALAFTWKVEGWKAGPPPVEALVAGESETTSASLPAGGKVIFKGKLIANFEIEATAVALSGGKIEQGAANAVDEGAFELQNVTVLKPEHCNVPGNKILLTNWQSEIVEVGAVVYDKFTPKAGTELGKLMMEGAECPIAEAEGPIKGTEYAVFKNNKMLEATHQLEFSPAVLAAAGGSLTVSTKAAELTMSPLLKLSGAKLGSRFRVE